MADDVTLKIGGDAKALVDALQQGGAAFEGFVRKATAESQGLSTKLHEISGASLLKDANQYAVAVQQIGGASKLTAAEQAKVNGVLTQAMAKYQALGQQAPESLKKLAAETQRVDQATDQAAQTSTSFSGVLTGVVAGGVAAVATAALNAAQNLLHMAVQGFGEMIRRGSEVATIRGAFERLAGSVEHADEVVGSMRYSTSGLISDFDLMQASNKAMLLGLGNNTGQMADMSRTAIVLGRAMGQGPTKSLDDLITALGRSSPLILDNLGLSVKVGEANEIYAARLEKTVFQLSEAEKKQAFFNAAMDAARDKVQELGGVTLNASDRLGQLWTSTKNVTDASASWFVQIGVVNAALENAVISMRVWEGLLRDGASGATKAFAEATHAIPPEVAEVENAFFDASRAAGALELSEAELTRVSGELTERIEAQTKAAAESKKAHDALFGRDVIAKALDLADTLGDVSNVTLLSTEKQKALRAEVVAAIETYDRLGERAPAHLRAIEAATRPLIETTHQWGTVELRAALDHVTPFEASVRTLGVDSVPRLSASIDTSRLGFVALKPAVDDSSGAIRELREDGERLREAIPTWGSTLEAFAAEVPGLIQQAFTGGGGLRGAAEAGGSLFGESFMGQLFGKPGDESGAGSGLLKNMTGILGGVLGVAMPVLGSMLGPAISGVVSLLAKPEHEEIAKDVGRQWGVAISEGLAKEIEADAAELFNKDRVAGTIFNLDKVIEEAGGLTSANYDLFMGKLHDVFSMIDVGKFSVEQGRQVLDANFGAFAAQIEASGAVTLGTLQEIIDLNQQFGTDSAEIAAFTQRHLERATAGLAAGIEATGASVEQVERAGRSMGAALEAAQKRGLSLREAMEAAGPSIDTLIARSRELGVTHDNAALQELMRYRELSQQYGGLLERAANYGDTLQSLGFLGALNADVLRDMGQTGFEVYESLIAAGFTERQALEAQREGLEAIAKAHYELGIPVDENTAKLLEQAHAQGVLTAEGESMTEILLAGFAALIEAVGGEMPEAFRRFQQAGTNAAGAVDRAIAKIPRTVDITVTGRYDGPDGAAGGFAQGTRGHFPDFGAGTPTVLHGREAVVPYGERFTFALQQLAEMRRSVGTSAASRRMSLPMLGSSSGGSGGTRFGDVHVSVDARGSRFDDPASVRELALTIKREIELDLLSKIPVGVPA